MINIEKSKKINLVKERENKIRVVLEKKNVRSDIISRVDWF